MKNKPLSQSLLQKIGDHAVEVSQDSLVELLRGEHHFRVESGIPQDAVLVGIMVPGLGQRGDIITLVFDRPVPKPIVHRLACDPGGAR